MKLQEQRYEVTLPGIDRQALIVLRRQGQEDPATGDRVKVRWEIHLPAENLDLVPGICYCRRVWVAGAPLFERWGRLQGDHQVRAGSCAARTWSEAYRLAEDHARGELQHLIDALEARQKALEDAEEE